MNSREFKLVSANETEKPLHNLKVIGVGGCGCNAIRYMLDKKLQDVEFIAANTDQQSLRNIHTPHCIELGNGSMRGMGAGMNPELGRQSAEADRDRLAKIFKGSDLLFIAAGMGGGTGTGAAPIIAEIARELNILTVAVVTKPFEYEGEDRMLLAEKGVAELKKHVNSIIVMSNQNLMRIHGSEKMQHLLRIGTEVLTGAVESVSELITCAGTINVDFGDVTTVLNFPGLAVMSSAVASGKNRAQQAIEEALSCPLLDNIEIKDAQGVLININADSASGHELEVISNTAKKAAAQGALVKCGHIIEDSDYTDDIKVTLIITGIPDPDMPTEKQPHILKPTPDNSVMDVNNPSYQHQIKYDELSRPTYLRKQCD